MATRAPSTNSGGQAGLRSRDSGRGPVDDGVVFRSMKEFYWWVIIVTLLLFINLTTWVGLVYQDKKLKRTEALCLRIEEKEKKYDRRKKTSDEE